MPSWLRKLVIRRRLEREMQDELAFHLDARAADLVRSGLSPGEAHRQARIEFGGTERYKECLRDARHFGWIEALIRDFAYACRNFRRAPLFVLSAAGAIALGVGVNSALFSIVYGILFRPLPVADAGAIRIVYMNVRGEGSRSFHGSSYFVSFPEFVYLRANAKTAELAGISEAGLSAPFAPEGLHAQLVSDNLLPLMGAHPAAGRFFTRQEAAVAGSVPVAVLAYETWQRYFSGADIVGRVVMLNRTPFTIIGIANPGFSGPLILKADIWLPITMQAITRAGESLVDDANAGFIEIFARKKTGAADSAVLAEMQVLGHQAVTAHAPAMRAVVLLAPGAMFNYPEVMSHSVPVLAILFSVVSLVLLVACANVANMLVARGFSRAREIAIRLSIGAAKSRLIRQLLTEHLLLGLLGGAAGLALSQVAVRALRAALPTLGEDQLNLSLDWRIVLWTLLVALAAGVVFGIPSAFGITRDDLTQSLRGDAFAAGVRHRRYRLQSILVATQVAVSALLLINAGLLVRAARNAITLDPGMAIEHVLIVKPNLRDLQFTPAQAERYFQALRERAAALPGITAAAWTGFEPINASCGGQAGPVQPDGSAKPMVQISCHQVGADFLKVMRLRLLEGRAFESADDRPGAKVAIVDESFARRFLPGNPLGRRIRLGGKTEHDREVVGVVASVRPLMFLQPDYPQVYTPLTGMRFLEARLVVAYEGPAGSVSRLLQALAPQLDSEVALFIKPIEENVSSALSFVRLAARALATLGALALFLACTGVYGVVAFTVSHRRREIGVRLALGAQAASVMRFLAWQSLRPVLLGAAIGAGLSVAGSSFLRAMLYGISPLDPIGYASALFLLAVVAATAVILPASTALSVDPAATLRHD
jgi:putative ABC transport system permease protein